MLYLEKCITGGAPRLVQFGAPFFCSLVVALIFALILTPFYFLFGVLHYNPLLSITDISTNVIFSLGVISITGSPVIALALLLLLYVVGWVKFFIIRRNLVVDDLFDLSEFFQVSTLTTIAEIILFFVFFITIVWLVNRRAIQLRRSLLWLFFPLSLVVAATTCPEAVFESIKGKHIENFNRGADFLWGGQLYSVAYDFIEKRVIQKEVTNYKNSPFKNRVSFADAKIKKNIHIILLESFTSPIRLGVVEPGNRALSYQGLGRLTYAVAPVFGGNSAGSEYEILCGNIESYGFGGLTFNSFGRGKGSSCLPNLLKESGYDSIATTGTKKHFFNADRAYFSMGFDHFFSYEDHPKQDLDGIRISDREMFATNRVNLVQRMRETGKPILNYLATIAGHGPYYLNDVLRPIKIGHGVAGVQQYLNRIWYTSQELNEHLGQLKEIDPDSIVFIVGDHLVGEAVAAMSSKVSRNDILDKRLQDYVLLDNFKQVDAGHIAHNEVSAVIRNILSGSGAVALAKDRPIATNMGYFDRESLAPIKCDGGGLPGSLCSVVESDKAYHRELGLNIIKASLAH